MAVRWWFLLVILAATERTSCQNKFTTEPGYSLTESLGYFKKSDKLLNTLYHHDYQDTVQELVRAHREIYPDLSRGFHKKASKILDHVMSEDYHQSIDLLSPMMGKRRVRSQKMRREKLNIQECAATGRILSSPGVAGGYSLNPSKNIYTRPFVSALRN